LICGPSLGLRRFGHLWGCSDLNRKTNARVRRFEEEAIIHLDSLFASALKMTRSQVEAEDLVQETYLRAFRFYDKFRPGTNCRAWLFRIMTNIFINKYNRYKSRPEFNGYDLTGDNYMSSRPVPPDFIQNQGYDSDWISANLVDDDIRALLLDLPEHFRIALILSDIQDFSYAQVAEITNVKIGTVKSRLFRARRRLREGLWKWAVANGYAPEGFVSEPT
jgi:RNA polymerase sigma-70 factor (ECF subfamily)